MPNEKVKITIEFNKNDYYRIKDAVQHRNLVKEFTNSNYEDNVASEQEFIVGAVINYLEYVELFAHPTAHPELVEQDKRIIKNTIKHYLKKHNIKQVELAKVTGIEKGNLSSMLNNNYQPSLDSFIKIWSALNFPPLDELLYREYES